MVIYGVSSALTATGVEGYPGREEAMIAASGDLRLSPTMFKAETLNL